MRSNDVWLGLPYDVFAFTTIQRLIAEQLKLDLGTYYHQAGSEHLYNRNREQALKAISWGGTSNVEAGIFTGTNPLDYIDRAVETEHTLRTGEGGKYELPPILHDLVYGARSKDDSFYNPLFKEYQKCYKSW
jgi:thymidylate synthase